MMRHRLFALTLASAMTFVAAPASSQGPVVHVYNWSDYITQEALEQFQKETGIKIVYDVYDANEVLEAKLLAGKSGYDVIFPTARPFAERHIKAGLYRKLERSKLPNYDNLDPAILKSLEGSDPGNQYLVPYMWGATGIGYNVAKVEEILGEDAPTDSWRLIFDPTIAAKLAGCGITLLDDEVEALAAALLYAGRDPNSSAPADLDEAARVIGAVRPHIRYFHSSQYINDLANGDVCVVQGYSGDVFQARDRAEEAGNEVEIKFTIPSEGAIMSTDVMAIPADAPHPENAHAFIDFLLRPEVIAPITNYISYANANLASLPLLDESLRADPGVYPPPAVMAKMVTAGAHSPKDQRQRVRVWTRIKTGR